MRIHSPSLRFRDAATIEHEGQLLYAVEGDILVESENVHVATCRRQIMTKTKLFPAFAVLGLGCGIVLGLGCGAEDFDSAEEVEVTGVVATSSALSSVTVQSALVYSTPLNGEAFASGIVSCPSGTVPFSGGFFAHTLHPGDPWGQYKELPIKVVTNMSTGTGWAVRAVRFSSKSYGFVLRLHVLCGKKPSGYELVKSFGDGENIASPRCPSGKQAISGGYNLASSTPLMRWSFGQSWGWLFSPEYSEPNVRMEASVICADKQLFKWSRSNLTYGSAPSVLVKETVRCDEGTLVAIGWGPWPGQASVGDVLISRIALSGGSSAEVTVFPVKFNSSSWDIVLHPTCM